MIKKFFLLDYSKVFFCSLLFILPFLGFSQTFTKLFDFNGISGSKAYGDLISDGDYFYGTTTVGGSNDKGVIFKIKSDGTDYQKLYNFDEVHGAKPYDGLQLIGSELFGVTLYGGTNNGGIIFKIDTNGSNYSVLKDFSNSNDGAQPNASLYFDGTFLYGTTYSGGTGGGGGTIFKLNLDGTGFTVIHNFNGSNTSNGAQPQAQLLSDGTYLYGVTFNGGTNNKGVLYKIKPDGTNFLKLYDFVGTNNTNNVEPSEPILHEGYLYGCTFLGGANELGTLYKIATDGSDFSVLHDFDTPTGAKPHCKLTLAGDYLYGTTTTGGLSGGGMIFKIKPDGTDYSSIFEFVTESGYSCWSSLLYKGSYLYGITSSGGDGGDNGTIFQFDDGLPLSNPNVSAPTNIAIYPNPVQDVLYISLPENTKADAILYDVAGKLVLRETIVGNAAISLNSLKSGVYFLQVGNNTQKIIKE
jgi:uncharacterized repeat protein (TIGR03803 family)